LSWEAETRAAYVIIGGALCWLTSVSLALSSLIAVQFSFTVGLTLVGIIALAFVLALVMVVIGVSQQ
jgi:hypothetical protein